MKSRILRRLAAGTMLTCATLGLYPLEIKAQPKEEQIRIGVQGALQANFLGLGYQNLLPGVPGNFVYFVLNDGVSFAPYIGSMGEWHGKNGWGAQLRLSYDSRYGSVTDDSYTEEPRFDLYTSYVTIEPLIRWEPLSQNSFHVVAGPLVAFNVNATADYYATKDGPITRKGVEIPDMNAVTFGLTAGLGYDFLVGTNSEKAQNYYISPFLEGSWMMNQRKSSFESINQDIVDDVWSTVSLRAGVRASVGFVDRKVVEITDADESMFVSLFTPADGVLRSRQVDDYFPLLQYVFFDSAQTAIPDRYRKISKSEAASFDEENLPNPSLADADKYSTDQMNAYYNVLNILGSRMKANPESTIQLVGAAGKDGNDGGILAESIKKYLVETFDIAERRISTTGQKMPRRPSGSAATPAEFRPLTDIENRRVEIVTNSAALKKPVKVRTKQTNPLDNDLAFSLDESLEITSWQVVLESENTSKTFGPFTELHERINPASMMEGLERGTYTAKIFVGTAEGKTLSQERTFQLVRRPEEIDTRIGKRYSLIFEFGQSDPVKLYESFLREQLAPLVEPGSRLIVHGHTDNVGSEEANLRISTRRARQVKELFQNEFAKPGNRKSVQLEYKGFGKDPKHSYFDNTLPEGRFYNRGVTIDIIPPKK